MQFDRSFPEAVVEKYNEVAVCIATAQAAATSAETVSGADIEERTSATGSASVAVSTGTVIQNANNLGSAAEELTGGGPPVLLGGASTAFGNMRMKLLTAEQAMQVKRALIGRRLHFYDRMRGHKEPSSGGGGLKLVKSITDFTHSRKHGSSHQFDKGLLLLIIRSLLLVSRSVQSASLECVLRNINSTNTLHVCYV